MGQHLNWLLIHNKNAQQCPLSFANSRRARTSSHVNGRPWSWKAAILTVAPLRSSTSLHEMHVQGDDTASLLEPEH